MNNYYKQPVVLFGLVTPLLVLALIAFGAYYGYSKIEKSYQAKEKIYKQSELARKKTVSQQQEVAKISLELTEWQKLLARETRGTFVGHWKEAERKFSGKELTRSPHSWTNFSPGLGKGVSQPSSQVTMHFSGTYRAMQASLMEVESKLPQMQLDSMTMAPDGIGGRINFVTKFTIWTQN